MSSHLEQIKTELPVNTNSDAWPDRNLPSCFAHDGFCVYRNENYNAFPDLVRTQDGTLVCAWRPGDDHRPVRYSGLAVSLSHDNGKSWSAPNILEESLSIEEISWDCPSLSVLNDGRIAMVVNAATGRDSTNRNIGGIPALFLYLSSDNGKTWTTRQQLPFSGVCPGKLLKLKDGAWLVTSHYETLVQKKNRLVQYAWRSKDEGKSWSQPYIMAKDSRYNFCEASVIEFPDGTLIAYMREDSRKGIPMFKSISKDGGRTWNFWPTNITAGHRPRAGILQNGLIFISYRLYHHRMQVGGNTFGHIEAEWSAREPDWQKQHGFSIPIISDLSPLGDGGYTGWVQDENGIITLVNYGCGSHPVPWIYGIRLDPAPLCNSVRYHNRPEA